VSKGYIYNALDDVTLPYAGRFFFIPKGKVTVIEDVMYSAPDRRPKPGEEEPEEGAMLENKRSGLEVAHILANRHRQDRKRQGFWVGDKEPSEADQKMCQRRATEYKRQQIASARKERADRLANVPGRNDYDDQIIRWMEELGISDDIHATATQAGPAMTPENIAQIANAVVQANRKAEKEPVGAKG
jgi:hypothetical protein